MSATKYDKLEGTLVIRYPNGRIKSEMAYNRGLLDGCARGWWPNGNLRYERNYRRGALHGDARSWDESGKLCEEKSYLRGVSISDELKRLVKTNGLTARSIMRVRHVAVRAALIEAMGYARFLHQRKHQVLDSHGDSSLVRVDWHPKQEPLYLVKVRCPSTGTYYSLRVPPGVQNVREAVAWTFGLGETEFCPEEES